MTIFLNLVFQFVGLYIGCFIAHRYTTMYGFWTGFSLWMVAVLWSVAASIDKDKALKEAGK